MANKRNMQKKMDETPKDVAAQFGIQSKASAPKGGGPKSPKWRAGSTGAQRGRSSGKH
jgi:hypothetical protein